MANNIKPIDKVTTTLLDIACRACDIRIDIDILDDLIDLVELIEDKGGKVNLKDIARLQKSWKKNE